jgi:hypothetical protein
MYRFYKWITRSERKHIADTTPYSIGNQHEEWKKLKHQLIAFAIGLSILKIYNFFFDFS